MASLAVTAKGQGARKWDLLEHVGITSGESIGFETLSDGESQV
ncbi:hypothetical protein [Xylella taiwanensis]|nr:hypothetical protein [Xylella taiwanensis]